MPSTTYNQIAGAATQWRDAQPILTKLRTVKSPTEIALLRRAARQLTHDETAVAAARPGATHGDIVAAALQLLVPAGGALQLVHGFRSRR
jgi:Xaa-Pro aminopeptidase